MFSKHLNRSELCRVNRSTRRSENLPGRRSLRFETLDQRLLLTVELSLAGTYETGIFDDGGAEIVDFYDGKLFVTNANAARVDVLDASDITAPSLDMTLPVVSDTANFLGRDFSGPTSVAVNGSGLVAVAIPADPATDPGAIAFYNAADNSFLGAVEVGALPDAVIFTPDNNILLSADEGEPDDDYVVDPEGSVSLVAVDSILTDGNVTSATVSIAGFTAFNADKDELLDEGIRIFGPGATAGSSRLHLAC